MDIIVVSVGVRHIAYTGYAKSSSGTQKFIELWSDQNRKSSSSYERIKNKQVTVLLSNQKARKRYSLLLLELFFYIRLSLFQFHKYHLNRDIYGLHNFRQIPNIINVDWLSQLSFPPPHFCACSKQGYGFYQGYVF